MREIKDIEFGYDISAYLEYLKASRDKMPSSALYFATAAWHYDFTHHQCPHDSWLESLVMNEAAGVAGKSRGRELSIHARFLGAYHDLQFEILYKNVTRYELSLVSATRGQAKIGHGDWIIDEVLCLAGGGVSHEIVFSDSGRWLIECEDIEYSHWPWWPDGATKGE